MIVSLICEPRSGSHTLMYWFGMQKDFNTLFLPHYNSIDYKNHQHNKKHLFIKEEFHGPGEDFKELIKFSDYVIFLYRENLIEQVESWVKVQKTKNWHGKWVYNKNKFKVSETDIKEFESLKNLFKKKYLDNEKNFKISYEDLYYNNGIEKIIEYLNVFNLDKNNFPTTEKYRINFDGDNLI